MNIILAKRVLLIGFLSLVIMVLGFIISGIYSFKNSEAYIYAKEYTSNNPEVNEKVGKVISYGFMVGGEKSSEQAHLNFSVYGEKGNVGIIIDLHKESDGWKVDKLSSY